MEVEKKDVVGYIRRVVAEKKITQKKLSEMFGVTNSCINLIVKGKRYGIA